MAFDQRLEESLGSEGKVVLVEEESGVLEEHQGSQRFGSPVGDGDSHRRGG